VTPILMNRKEDDTEVLFEHAVERAEEEKLIEEGDVIILTAGMPLGISGTTNLIKAVMV
jgi:pyruvate kinase